MRDDIGSLVAHRRGSHAAYIERGELNGFLKAAAHSLCAADSAPSANGRLVVAVGRHYLLVVIGEGNALVITRNRNLAAIVLHGGYEAREPDGRVGNVVPEMAAVQRLLRPIDDQRDKREPAVPE